MEMAVAGTSAAWIPTTALQGPGQSDKSVCESAGNALVNLLTDELVGHWMKDGGMFAVLL